MSARGSIAKPRLNNLTPGLNSERHIAVGHHTVCRDPGQGLRIDVVLVVLPTLSNRDLLVIAHWMHSCQTSSIDCHRVCGLAVDVGSLNVSVQDGPAECLFTAALKIRKLINSTLEKELCHYERPATDLEYAKACLNVVESLIEESGLSIPSHVGDEVVPTGFLAVGIELVWADH